MTFKKKNRLLSLPARLKTILAGSAAMLLLTGNALAQYPDRPITLIVPFPAGSGTDAVGRIFAEEIGKRVGQTIIVENRPGANATIAANYVKRAAPDGYTLFVTTNTSHSAAPWLMKNVPYDPVKDFTPIARGGNLPFILVTNPDRPYSTVEQMLQYAKDNPGQITYASGNSTGIVAGGTLDFQTGMKALHVPYKGTPQALTDLVAGQVDFMFTDVTSGLPFINSGRLKALAVSTAKRSALLPDLPAMEEVGLSDFDITSWNGFFGPAGMDPERVQLLNRSINEVIQDDAVRQRLAQLGFDAFSGPPEEFAQFVQEQYTLWGKLITDAKLGPQ
ncbi:Bug family tripartite tricarboxylate transporter substrate binding protein [Alcaligenes aquatilis]|jgi:tripartite-type tricarboxylate transporter receptor subunit TctC|uniref:Bug family tripartite tricarboxylate transporter substrate binding protein n=1 Tax=Alcaligenes aquatilis TaxID=323284 RepID=UPI00267950CF